MEKLNPEIVNEADRLWDDSVFREDFFKSLPEIQLPENVTVDEEVLGTQVCELSVQNSNAVEGENDQDVSNQPSQNLSAPSCTSLTSTVTTASSSSSSGSRKRFLNFRKCCKSMKKWLTEDPRIHLPSDPAYLFPQYSTAILEAKRMKTSRSGRPRIKNQGALPEGEKEYHRRYYATTKKWKNFIFTFTKKYSDGHAATMKLEDLNYPDEIDNIPSSSSSKSTNK